MRPAARRVGAESERRVLPPGLRQRLARAHLVAGTAIATRGVGERRSRSKGEGIEFEEHRRYRPGDDLRRVDARITTRLGEPYVREFNVARQLAVTILLDVSGSMGLGRPEKLRLARSVASGLAYVALANADRVQIGAVADGRVTWSPRRSGLGHHDELDGWLRMQRAGGATALAAAAAGALGRLDPDGMVLVVSDLWSDDAEAALTRLAATGVDLVVIQVVAPGELDPVDLGHGGATLRDVESAASIELAIDSAAVERYRDLSAAWTDRLRQRTHAARGRFLTVASDTTVSDVFLRQLPAAGVVR
jgi:uncharacterized protein (DUF58 family)